MRRSRWLGILFAVVILTGARARASGSSIEDDIAILTHDEGPQVSQAAARLAKVGRQAVIPIEAALPAASPAGRKNLILALRRVGDASAIPALLRVALADRAPDVRREALWTLKLWAKPGSKAGAKSRGAGASSSPQTRQRMEARAAKARAALREIDETTARREQG